MTIQVSSSGTELSTPATPAEKRQAYLQKLLDQKPAASDKLQAIRDRALTLVQEQALPSNKDEEWRFTDLAPLYKVEFQAATSHALTAEQVSTVKWDGVEHVAVFINGCFSAEFSNLDKLPAGITFNTLADATAETLQRISQNPGANEIFTALNSAAFEDAALVQIAKNVIVESPLHCLFISNSATGAPSVNTPRLLVDVETGASAALVEEYVSIGDEATWTNTVAEVTLGANAELKHSRIQRESKATFHIGKTSVTQARDSRYHSVNIGLGGQISRHTPEVTLLGNQTETNLDGLTLAAETQVADTHSTLAFTTDHCSANQLHKCIIDDSAQAVFNGKVFVPQAAQQTDAAQLSRNLLLSPKARVNTKPQLEIVADDVKCAHGATVSQLEDDEVFYLQSRGLDRESACDLLIEAFAAEIIDKCPAESMRQGLLQQVLDQVR